MSTVSIQMRCFESQQGHVSALPVGLCSHMLSDMCAKQVMCRFVQCVMYPFLCGRNQYVACCKVWTADLQLDLGSLIKSRQVIALAKLRIKSLTHVRQRIHLQVKMLDLCLASWPALHISVHRIQAPGAVP